MAHRIVNLNGVFYTIDGIIRKWQLNPFKGKLGGAGSELEYTDFGQAELKEWHDFRNGIGLEGEVEGETARQWWCENIDTSISRSTVLGPLATTAGSFGATPIRIFDFDGSGSSKTYGVGDDLIAEWDTGTSAWVSKETGLSDPLDSLIVTDKTDTYAVVSANTEAYYSTDGSTWTRFFQWVSPDGNDPEDDWSDGENAYDDDTSTKATMGDTTASSWSNFLELTLTNSVRADAIRYYYSGTQIDKIYIDVYYDDAWHNILDAAGTKNAFTTVNITGGPFTVSKARIKLHKNATGSAGYLHEFDFQHSSHGYMAQYADKLYFLSTNGRYLTSSTAQDIDAYGGFVELIGDFGTVYGLFVGKLLSETTTSTLYMHSNKGLWAIDVSEQKVYPQEINYPDYTYAGKVARYINANIWAATGAGLLKVGANTATPIGPNCDDGLPATYQGYISDLTRAGDYIVYSINGGTTDKSSILKRNMDKGGNLQVYTTSAVNKPIGCIHFSPSSMYTNGRLWFGEGTDIKYIMMPDLTANVKQISTYAYCATSDKLIFPRFRRLAAIAKTALGVKAVTKGCNTNEYITVYYRLNDATTWQTLGTFKSSPLPTALPFGSGLGSAFYTVQFAVDLRRRTTGESPEIYSPELESLLFYYLPAPTPIHAWSFKIRCTDEDAQATLAALEALESTGTLVTFYPSGDTSKTSYNVKVTQVPEEVYWEQEGGKEGIIEVTVEQIFEG